MTNELTARLTGRQLYQLRADNDPIIHCNRFPLWSELSRKERADWNAKAKRLPNDR